MTSRTLMIVCAVVLALALVFAFTDNAAAQADDQVSGDTSKLKSKDKDLSQKRGVQGALTTRASEEEEESNGPSALQMGLGLGSCVVMIIVVKWL